MNWLASSAFRFASVSLFSSALLFATAGCEDPNDLGVELPGTIPVGTEYRDFPVTASTVLQKPVQTLNSTHYLVGKVQDAKLGTTTAKSYFNLQVLQAGSAIKLPTEYINPILDSAVVVASFDQVYGSSSAPVSYDVLRLVNPLDEQGTYNSTTNVAVSNEAIGTNLKSSLNRTMVEQRTNGLRAKIKVLVNGVLTEVDSTTSVTVPDRTVRLTIYRKAVGTLPAVSSTFVESIFADISNKNTPFTQAVLDNRLKGIAIVPSSDFSGSMVSFNRALTNRVVFYYHVSGTDNVTVPTPYPISFENSEGSANAPRAFTQLGTEFTPPFVQLNDPKKSVPSAVSDQVIYMQDGVGLGARLEIPGLTDLISNKEGLAINRAELLIPVKSSTNLLFPAPSQAVLYELDANNTILQRTINISPFERLVQADGASQQSVGANAVATLRDLSRTNKYYSLSMTSYLQAYVFDALAGERPAAFMLFPTIRYSSSSVDLTLNRAALDAQNIKLRVYFSKLR
jgi:hypothetical protein